MRLAAGRGSAGEDGGLPTAAGPEAKTTSAKMWWGGSRLSELHAFLVLL